MSKPIEINSRFVYIVKGDGHLFHHRVVSRDQTRDAITSKVEQTVTTWSIHTIYDLETNGWSWHGPIDQFIKQFRPALPSEGK